jgi:hypothetical protein
MSPIAGPDLRRGRRSDDPGWRTDASGCTTWRKNPY